MNKFIWQFRRRRDQDLDAEIRAHLAMAERYRIEQGDTAQGAASYSRREFGNRTLIQEVTREIWGWMWLERFAQDLSYAMRILRKNWTFTFAAVVSLGLGIGANTAIFSVLNAVLFRPLPYRNPEQLVTIWRKNLKEGITQGLFSYPDFLDLRSQGGPLNNIGAHREAHSVALTGLDAEHVDAEIVSPHLLDLLGTTPELGRTFRDDENDSQSIVISHQLWLHRFNSDPSIIGRTVSVDRRPYTVIGVMPAEFEFPILAEPVQVWLPIWYDKSMLGSRGVRTYNLVGRLPPTATLLQADSRLAATARHLAEQFPETHKPDDSIQVERLATYVLGPARNALWILLGAAGMVLLIACANVANLILVGATTRAKELSVRAALGASRTRILRQLITENLLLSLLGGTLGILLGYWAIIFVARMGPRDIPRISTVNLNSSVLSFALLLSFGCTFIFGLAPALRLSRKNINDRLGQRGYGSGSTRREGHARAFLIVGELAVSVMMVTACGLLLQSLWNLQRIDPGFRASHVLTFNVDLPDTGYPGSRRARLFERLLSDIRSLPGVTSASMVFPLPFSGSGIVTTFDVADHSQSPSDIRAALCAADFDYFRTMKIPLLKGRVFSNQDAEQKRPVAVITDSFARRYFGNTDPIGKRIKAGAEVGGVPAQMSEIIGVVSDLRLNSLREMPSPTVFLPITAFPINAMNVVIRTQGDPRQLLLAIRERTHRIDPNVLIIRGKTLDQYLASLLGTPKFNAFLLSIFATLALTLATVGLYGVMSFFVRQRFQEIGIRMALGATPSNILQLVLGDGIRFAATGIVVGLAGALAATRLLTSLLFAVGPTDPSTYLKTTLISAAVCALACYVPAKRAMRIDPTVALRYE